MAGKIFGNVLMACDLHQWNGRNASGLEEAARLISMRSVSKRTGTSNSKPAVTLASAPRAARSTIVTSPVVSSTEKSPGRHLGRAIDRHDERAGHRLFDRPDARPAGAS